MLPLFFGKTRQLSVRSVRGEKERGRTETGVHDQDRHVDQREVHKVRKPECQRVGDDGEALLEGEELEQQAEGEEQAQALRLGSEYKKLNLNRSKIT